MRKHGMCESSIYHIWEGIKARCLNPKHNHYHRYGGRGISFDPRWEIFENFYADVLTLGERPSPGHSLERMDNTKGYFIANLKWASRKEQQRNTVANQNITYNNKTQCISAWAEELGVKRPALVYRIKTWGVEKAFAAKVRAYTYR